MWSLLVYIKAFFVSQKHKNMQFLAMNIKRSSDAAVCFFSSSSVL